MLHKPSLPLSQTMPTYLRAILIFALVATLTQCGIFKSGKGKDSPDSERALYETAQKALDNKQYGLAIESLRKIELRYPFGRYAEQAQLESIYAYYKNFELAAASASADRFIRQHPEHPNIDYAYYMKGLSSFNVDKGMLDRFLKDAAHKRDLGSAKDSYKEFKELIERFPDSDYSADAQKRMIHLRDLISRHEIGIANYYMQRSAYVAAANRGRYVVENFPNTSATADALAIMTSAYHEMGMSELASDSLTVLKHNFPNYEGFQADGSLKAYAKLYEENPHWLNFLSFGLIKTKHKSIKAKTRNEPSANEPRANEPSTNELDNINLNQNNPDASSVDKKDSGKELGSPEVSETLIKAPTIQ